MTKAMSSNGITGESKLKIPKTQYKFDIGNAKQTETGKENKGSRMLVSRSVT